MQEDIREMASCTLDNGSEVRIALLAGVEVVLCSPPLTLADVTGPPI
jgi:hypothetical protein